MLYDLNGTDDDDDEAVDETPVGEAHAVPPAIPPAVKPDEAEPAGAEDAEAAIGTLLIPVEDAVPASARPPKRKRRPPKRSDHFVCKIANGTEIDLCGDDDVDAVAAPVAAAVAAAAGAVAAVATQSAMAMPSSAAGSSTAEAVAVATQSAMAVPSSAAGSSTAEAAAYDSAGEAAAAGVPPAATSQSVASPPAGVPAGKAKGKMPVGKGKASAAAPVAAPRASQRSRGVLSGPSAATPPPTKEERRERKREAAARLEQAKADADRAWELSGTCRSGGGVAVMLESEEDESKEVELEDMLVELLVILRDPCCILDNKEGLIEILLAEAGCVWHERISAKSSREQLGGKRLDADLFVTLLEKDLAFAIPKETASKHWHLGDLETTLDKHIGFLNP